MLKLLILVSFCTTISLARRQCLAISPFVRFYKIQSCFKSKLSIISWKNFDNVTDCMQFAREKKGLAFNFSPISVVKTQNVRLYKNCQVLGCPEGKNSSTLVFDPIFDYYSAYGDFNTTDSTICIKSIGLFDVIQEKRNYTEAVEYCQSIGADLANILTETRTNSLAALLKTFKSWYKAAYVGLDDIKIEGVFETPLGNYLDCTTFRAWSPGHPRPRRKHEDCVILDANRVWRAINCKIKLGFICEFYPTSPNNELNSEIIPTQDCSNLKNRNKRRKCTEDLEFYEIFKNSSRIDQCALLNINY